MPCIKLVNIGRQFSKGAKAVDGLNLIIEDGDFVSLLGPSGCGKTTTLRMIAGLETPTEGEIYFDDKCVFSAEKGVNISPDKRDVGFLFQNYALWPHMTVRQNIAFGLENMKWEKAKIESRVKEICAVMRIAEYIDRYPAELSGGQQQRVAIARTLAPNPRVLLMDEPLSNLDAKLRNDMRAELKRLHISTGATFVYVTHDQLEAMTLATRICLMKAGVLQQYDPPLEVYNNPANLFVADFVGNPTMNFIPASVKFTDNTHAEVSALGRDFVFEADAPLTDLPAEGAATLGVRPEFVRLTEEERALSGHVYTAFPAGMETTLQIKADCGPDAALITSVEFGSVNYGVNTPVRFQFHGAGILLFDKDGGRIGRGSVALKA